MTGYCNPDAKIRYPASDMILNVHSDASYLSAPRAHSRAGGYFFLGSIPANGDPIKLNGAIHITCTILKLVAASAAKAELGALFLNAQEAKILRLTLDELGHPQPPTPIHMTTPLPLELSTTPSSNNNPTPWKCVTSGYWMAKCRNISNFITCPNRKSWVIILLNTTRPTHQHVQPYYVHTETSPTILPRALKPSIWRGCAEILEDPYAKKSHYHVLGP
jgi:hypothetical protein